MDRAGASVLAVVPALDASVALAWAFRDEPLSSAELALDAVTRETVLVPAFWPFEIASGLRQAERQGRIDPGDIPRFTAGLSGLPATVDDALWAHVFGDVMDIARKHNLSIYDAAYLDLALRESLPLATLDRSLARTARQAGVALFE